eukprot:5752309-Amphidinium_carterae.1
MQTASDSTRKAKSVKILQKSLPGMVPNLQGQKTILANYVESSRHTMDNYQDNTNEGNQVVRLRNPHDNLLCARESLKLPSASAR